MGCVVFRKSLFYKTSKQNDAIANGITTLPVSDSMQREKWRGSDCLQELQLLRKHSSKHAILTNQFLFKNKYVYKCIFRVSLE